MKSISVHILRDCSAVGGGASRGRAFSYRFTRKSNQTRLSFPNLITTSYGFKSCSATLSVVAEVEEKPKFDVHKTALLVKELRKSFNSGRTRGYEWRVSQLKSIEKMIDEKEKEITEALHKDLSKPELEAFISEISQAKSSCKLALKELSYWMIPKKVKTSLTTYPSSAEIVSEPLGVVLVISTWNFPFLLSLDPVIGAISAGNAVVLKPSEIAPATSLLLSSLVEEYLDNSAIRVVQGAVDETTALLEQKWDKILYTGSARVGRIVMAAAAKHLTPVTLELGGKCPAVVDSNINLQVAVRRIIAGKWACNNGQACIDVDYIITTKEFAPKLIDSLIYELEQFFGKDPMESNDISRIVSSSHFARLVKLLDEDKVSDKIVLGGQRDENQLKIAPTILLDVPEDSLIMQEEIFGPLMPIVTVATDGLPFGGVGESGMGSYHGKFSFDAFSHKKAVLYRSFDGDASVRYPPYTPKRLRLLKALISGNIISIILALIGWSKD
ncbi:aldehyde dehydrogenase family 3 member I1, chloroplastic-like isoform X3 [Alnus glutinosa]|uniref:aldehyde dehydrogenase family 3 member I1, chloroplastic-like isoform X3 n=1 Tax=Alnus glutinosa TaxID=3517 RepID=UPI002D76A970|nr:aldehyde dehydrogenase family 3 member I1, chloroplastic-like isoform X3 [Alnus glutinosa]